MEISWFITLLIIFLGVIFGIISTIAGMGGGVFYVAFMTLFLLFPINISIDTSNFVILFTSAAGFYAYMKQKRTEIKITLIYGVFSVLGGIASTILLLMVKFDNTILEFLFGTVLIILGLNLMIVGIIKLKKDNENEVQVLDFKNNKFFEKLNYKKNLKAGIPLFFIAGFASNLLGIGGGVISTPVLNIMLGFPIHYSTAISTSMVFITAIFNSISKFLFGQVDIFIGILLGLSSVVGAILGAKISDKIPRFYLKIILSIVLILFGIRMYF